MYMWMNRRVGIIMALDVNKRDGANGSVSQF